jgi:hypothetical protein
MRKNDKKNIISLQGRPAILNLRLGCFKIPHIKEEGFACACDN